VQSSEHGVAFFPVGAFLLLIFPLKPGVTRPPLLVGEFRNSLGSIGPRPANHPGLARAIALLYAAVRRAVTSGKRCCKSAHDHPRRSWFRHQSIRAILPKTATHAAGRPARRLRVRRMPQAEPSLHARIARKIPRWQWSRSDRGQTDRSRRAQDPPVKARPGSGFRNAPLRDGHPPFGRDGPSRAMTPRQQVFQCGHLRIRGKR